ncbi:hypothetical protein AAFC00_000011 [Neodothiora populina]|uniref:Carboxylic ester hydrolase n=1 Tax=Neodothiora populina TaxID=2781224 RepID=A0ABR3P2G3_9PEZI
MPTLLLKIVASIALITSQVHAFFLVDALKSFDHVHDQPETKCLVGSAVNTTSGMIIGHPATEAPLVSEYLAIPFAQPPISELRFAPPSPYRGSGIVNSSSLPLNCPQSKVTFPGLIGNASTQLNEYLVAVTAGPNGWAEDCLYLNIWTKPQTGEAKKAVMVWFYGGAFKAGGSNSAVYNGQYFADLHDVIVVTFNYRVSALGFSGAPGLEQNVGLLDQRLAVEWVRDNIAAFGGDVDRITLFGESAGAASIDYYNHVYMDDPIIAGSIMESGSTTLGNATSNITAAALWKGLAANCSCGTGNESQVLACMRDVPIAQLVEYAAAFPFNPSVDNQLVFQNYTKLRDQGAFIKKPALIGNNVYEAAWFKLKTGLIKSESFWDAFNANVFTCVSNDLAQIRRLFHVPAWRYQFFPSFPDTELPYNASLATHTSEIPLVFGTFNDAFKSTPGTPEERSLSNFMMAYWSAFAKNPYRGLTEKGWPLYNQTQKSLALLGFQHRYSRSTLVRPDFIDHVCA